MWAHMHMHMHMHRKKGFHAVPFGRSAVTFGDSHGPGIHAVPTEYEVRVLGFFF